MQLKDPWS